VTTDAVLDANPKAETDTAPRKRNAERTRKAILAAALKESPTAHREAETAKAHRG